MMAYSEDHIALAGEYALGTLSLEERNEVEAMMASDPQYALVVDAWVRHLGALNQMVGAVEPRPEVWARIKEAIATDPAVQGTLSLTPSDALDMIAAAQAASAGHAGHAELKHADADAELAGAHVDRLGTVSDRVVNEPATVAAVPSNVIQFEQQIRRWRGIATTMSAVAALLVAFIGVQAYRPELLPIGARPKPVQTAQQSTPSPQTTGPASSAQYVALLQKDSTSPAFILTVDSATKNFTVRKVNASTEPGRSYELWIVSDKLQKPRSLGVIGGHDFTIRPDLAAYAPDTVNQATYAVTVEPEGGSPTGVATGPIVFTGKLIETVPQLK
jgi:anti-sigma-K factor RskA